MTSLANYVIDLALFLIVWIGISEPAKQTEENNALGMILFLSLLVSVAGIVIGSAIGVAFKGKRKAGSR
ncbi:hypothetical protein ACFFSY_01245 [Paenibacillus aurantiacus]|uniref:Uncharacterized protein n=1 Tax=Paenibacillus aurantiacus TaxID=1936118 RepID=A0ABV5KH61_9BACL